MFRLFKLFTLFFALLCIGTLAAPFEGSTTTSLRQSRGLERRQTIVQGTVCANVPVRITVGVVPYVSSLRGQVGIRSLIDIGRRR
jgi:hypothetical protein